MSCYEKERAIAEVATKEVREIATAIDGLPVHRPADNGFCAVCGDSWACDTAKLQVLYINKTNPQFVLGLLDRVEEVERLRRFVRHGSVCELRWRDGSGCDCGLAAALNPTEDSDA